MPHNDYDHTMTTPKDGAQTAVMTLDEVAHYLGMSRSTLWRLKRRDRLVFPNGKTIPLFTVSGRGWKAARANVDRFLCGE